MPGKNVPLKANQVLFKAGENSNGMYILRQGKLQVYLEKNSQTTVLATIETGGMIGEMSLFDQLPRSASVKAIEESEVTHITNEDFKNLMKQIPKWFTALMGTLSSRLRATNQQLQETLQKLNASNGGAAPTAAASAPSPTAAGGPPPPMASGSKQKMENILQALFVADLVFQKDGTKEGAGAKGSYKSFQVAKNLVMESLQDIFSISDKAIEHLFDALDAEKFVNQKGDKKSILSVDNKYKLGRFNKYLKQYIKTGGGAALTDTALDMMKVLDSLAEKSAYETVKITLKEMTEHAPQIAILSAKNWPPAIPSLVGVHEDLKPMKASAGEIAFRIKKGVLGELIQYQQVIRALAKINF